MMKMRPINQARTVSKASSMRGSAWQDVQDLTSQSESEEEPRMEPKGRAPRGNDLRNERPQVVKGRAQVIVERPKEKAKVSRYQTDHSRVDQYSKVSSDDHLVPHHLVCSFIGEKRSSFSRRHFSLL
eukprot:TRINITY_DN1051_c0_g1_i3.p1 TRINITY_DN1051_c0_g1~~TRINITY_DN1051_c0_g1_i3.p1  ORF type:complete len:127 (+),score=19.68 TRINITY_DN1051_c0_g1_i3:506-886(+)